MLWIHVYCMKLKKNINWEHVELDEGQSQFLTFLAVVYHIYSETETWPFVRLLPRMNSSKMQYKLYG